MLINNNVIVFRDTLKMCENNEFLKAGLESSLKRQYVLKEDDSLIIPEYDKSKKTHSTVSMQRTLEAANTYVSTGKKIGVLNFASAVQAGGLVYEGAYTQEEALCRISTLYPCISDEKIQEQFHRPHFEKWGDESKASLYNDDLIYTPDVVVFKSDTETPQKLAESEWFKVDVITCAAPNLAPQNIALKMKLMTKNKLHDIFKSRFRRIIGTAIKEKVEVLILGAFGCGAFHCPASAVATAMKETIEEFSGAIETVDVAIYCRDMVATVNYRTFDLVFHNINPYTMKEKKK